MEDKALPCECIGDLYNHFITDPIVPEIEMSEIIVSTQGFCERISSVHSDMSNPFVGTMIKRKSTSLRDGVPPLCLFAASRVLSACALMPCPIRKQNPTPRKTC